VLVIRAREDPSIAVYTYYPLEFTADVLLTKPRMYVSAAFPFYEFCRQNMEPTSGLEPLTCSLRVIHHVLQGCAGGCKSRIFRGGSFPCLAACCTVLRSRWYQCGIRTGDSYSLTAGRMARPRDLRSHNPMSSVTVRPSVSGNPAYLWGVRRFCKISCPLRNSLYQPGCSTVAVRSVK
jgi:hypothetical protein